MPTTDHAPLVASNATRHIDVMDGLRGLAILMVLLFHYWLLSFYSIPLGGNHTTEPIQYAGFLGVELFFFISGFCLFFPYASGRVPSLKHFFYRRAIKIVPSYLLALVLFAFVFTEVSPSTWHEGKLADLGLHVLFLQNMVSETHGSFDGVMWSLAVEVQFYLLFPLIAWAFRRQPFPTAAAMMAISIGYRAWNRHHASGTDLGLDADFLPAYLDLFGYGMLAATVMVWIRQRRETALSSVRIPFTLIAVLAVAVLWMLFDWVDAIRGDHPPGIWQSQNRPYLGLLFLTLAVASAFALPQWRKVLSNRVLVFLSTISYNLYLWHQGIGILVRNHHLIHARTKVPTDDHTWGWTYTLFSVALSILVASLITYLFERPLLRNGVRGSLERVREKVVGPREAAAAERDVPADDQVAV